jgi:hypothetical protein
MIMTRSEFSGAGWRADDPCAVGAALVRFVGNGKALASRAGPDGWCGGARGWWRARLVARRGWWRGAAGGAALGKSGGAPGGPEGAALGRLSGCGGRGEPDGVLRRPDGVAFGLLAGAMGGPSGYDDE